VPFGVPTSVDPVRFAFPLIFNQAVFLLLHETKPHQSANFHHQHLSLTAPAVHLESNYFLKAPALYCMHRVLDTWLSEYIIYAVTLRLVHHAVTNRQSSVYTTRLNYIGV